MPEIPKIFPPIGASTRARGGEKERERESSIQSDNEGKRTDGQRFWGPFAYDINKIWNFRPPPLVTVMITQPISNIVCFWDNLPSVQMSYVNVPFARCSCRFRMIHSLSLFKKSREGAIRWGRCGNLFSGGTQPTSKVEEGV